MIFNPFALHGGPDSIGEMVWRELIPRRKFTPKK